MASNVSFNGTMAPHVSLGLVEDIGGDSNCTSLGGFSGDGQKPQASAKTQRCSKEARTQDCGLRSLTSNSSIGLSLPVPGGFDSNSLLKEPFYTIPFEELKSDGILPSSDFHLTPPSRASILIGDNGGNIDQERRVDSSPRNGDADTTEKRFEKAWGLVQGVRRLCNDLGGDFHRDDASCHSLFHLTENLLLAQDRMRLLGRDTKVDIGYHYTTKQNLEKIKERGLLTKAEREAMGIYAKHNGSVHGDGVYTGNNMFAFMGSNFGNIGLLVARLRGKEQKQCFPRRDWDDEDTRVAGVGISEMVVLKESSQCIPLVDFDSRSMKMSDEKGSLSAAAHIHAIHLSLQQIVDTIFNTGAQTDVQMVLPSDSPQFHRIQRMKMAPHRRRRYSRKPNITRAPSPLPNSPAFASNIGSAQSTGNNNTNNISNTQMSNGGAKPVKSAAPLLGVKPSKYKQILAPSPMSCIDNDDGLFDRDTIDILLNINTPL